MTIEQMNGNDLSNPWKFVEDWYKEKEIFHNIQRQRNGETLLIQLPTDVYSLEFAQWLTHQYRLAMAKGIELGKDYERQLSRVS